MQWCALIAVTRSHRLMPRTSCVGPALSLPPFAFRRSFGSSGQPVGEGQAVAVKTAEHRPATRPRKYRHDEYTFVDLFSGFGGLTQGIVAAGFSALGCANHDRYKVLVHEANNPGVEHWIADLANPESSDYHSAADLPAADLLVAGITCTNHTIANTQRAYLQGTSLFDVDDSEWEERATRSERDRATATCVLQYAGKHHPRLILIECTTELQSWVRASREAQGG